MISKYLLSIVGALLASGASAADFKVFQTGKSFSATHLKIKLGDTIDFINNDLFFHNIYSLSEVKTFDLGSYPKGQGRKVTFDQLGSVNIECAIHPYMKMTVEVVK